MTKLAFGKAPVEPSFWFLEAGLYHSEDYKFEAYRAHGFDDFRKNLLAVIFPIITIDVYCPVCKKETVFAPAERKLDWMQGEKEIVKNGLLYAHFQCSRQHCSSDLYFVFVLEKGLLTKVGQLPSIADLLKPHLRQYARVLNADLLADWQRAVGLRAHGIGAGSYVYLRRIIEALVRQAADAAIKDGTVRSEDFDKARWSERIKMLGRHLPSYLVENAHVYSILSRGVHELSEAECTDYFDVMHTSLEIICDEKLAELEREAKAKSGSKALQRVMQTLAEKDKNA